MIIIAQNMMYPIAMRAIALRELPVMDRIYQYPLLLLNLMPSFVIIYLLVFYLIWDAILNCIAELTRFGDREFYGPWWNCVSWDQFARLWNIPVHKFLLRHVYHSSISAFKLSKTQATLFTFLLSSIIHEGAMFVLFHKVRGYLLFLQMCQLPLVAISKTRFLRDRHILGNVIFWCGIISGPSMMCTLYLTF
jgi:sterol O-acyltransferase